MLWKQLFELTFYCLEAISIQCFQTPVEHRKLQLQPVKLVLWDTSGPFLPKRRSRPERGRLASDY